jgi:uncharacterized RmlC-like cupin family protein
MEAVRPIVIRAREAGVAPGPPTPGMDRRQVLDHPNAWVGWVRTDAGVPSGWHHHGDRDTYLYVISGRLTIDYGPGGRDQVEATAGDVIFNPGHMVHRETTTLEGPVEAFVVRVGSGPQNVNAEGPDPG